MKLQSDYETEATLAVFQSAEGAANAVARLRELRVPASALTQVPLPPGRYQVEDVTLGEEGDGVRWGAALGAPVGAAVGVGLAAVLALAELTILAGLAAAGALGGLILGGYVGAIVRAHFDDDEAEIVEVPEGSHGTLVVLESSGRAAVQARRALQLAGAAGFLDATSPQVDEALRLGGTPHRAAATI